MKTLCSVLVQHPIGQFLTIFAYLKPLVLAQTFENPTVSIIIIGYVQTKSSRQFTMSKWIQPAIRCRLCSNGKFLADMDRSDDQSHTLFAHNLWRGFGPSRPHHSSRQHRTPRFLYLPCLQHPPVLERGVHHGRYIRMDVTSSEINPQLPTFFSFGRREQLLYVDTGDGMVCLVISPG